MPSPSPSPPTPDEQTTTTLQSLYLTYLASLATASLPAVTPHLSPTCTQLARQNPLWNLSSRAAILAALARSGAFTPSASPRPRGKVAMRALTPEERATLPAAESEQARREGWQGLRVEMEDAEEGGRRVVVNYYWRWEGGGWVQCLHDLVWVQGREGEDVGEVVFGVKGGGVRGGRFLL